MTPEEVLAQSLEGNGYVAQDEALSAARTLLNALEKAGYVVGVVNTDQHTDEDRERWRAEIQVVKADMGALNQKRIAREQREAQTPPPPPPPPRSIPMSKYGENER